MVQGRLGREHLMTSWRMILELRKTELDCKDDTCLFLEKWGWTGSPLVQPQTPEHAPQFPRAQRPSPWAVGPCLQAVLVVTLEGGATGTQEWGTGETLNFPDGAQDSPQQQHQHSAGPNVSSTRGWGALLQTHDPVPGPNHRYLPAGLLQKSPKSLLPLQAIARKIPKHGSGHLLWAVTLSCCCCVNSPQARWRKE